MWSFGAPGHGKGIWDGLGGIIKHMLMRWILQHEHVIKDEFEAFKIIEQLFQSDQYRHSVSN